MINKHCFVSIDVEEDLSSESSRSYRGVEGLDGVLTIFKRFRIKATLFVTGEVLERYPNLIRAWAKEHEIACHGFFDHRLSNELKFSQKQENLSKFLSLYRNLLGAKPLGFRAVQNLIFDEDLDLLESADFCYDSSVVPSYVSGRRYIGFRGRSPHFPYRPDKKDYKKIGKRKITEIPLTPLVFGIPLSGTWVRYFTPRLYKFLLFLREPGYLCLSLHSWEACEFEGKFSRNSGRVFMAQLEEILKVLQNRGYQFLNGEQCLKLIDKN